MNSLFSQSSFVGACLQAMMTLGTRHPRRVLDDEGVAALAKSPASRLLLRGWLAFLSVLLASSAVVSAQTRDELKAQRKATHRQVKSEARALAKNGDLAAAEQAILALNVAPPGSAAWHLETAQRLVQLAGDLSRSGKGNLAQVAASRALAALAKADRLPADAMLKSAIRRQEGFVYERYLGDVENAKTSYRAAAQLLPQNASAQEKLKQIEETDASTRRKLGKH